MRAMLPSLDQRAVPALCSWPLPPHACAPVGRSALVPVGVARTCEGRSDSGPAEVVDGKHELTACGPEP